MMHVLRRPTFVSNLAVIPIKIARVRFCLDLEMLTGEEGRDGKEFDGSLVNMVQSELDDFDTASYHSSNSEALVTPPVPTNKSAPPRPPPSSARAVSGRSVPTKEAFDPWASPQDSEQLIGYSTVPTVTPVQQDALSWPDVAPTQLSGFGVNGSANIGQVNCWCALASVGRWMIWFLYVL